MEQGFKLEINEDIKIVKCFLTHSVFDKPARAAVLNIKSSHGYFGCLKCKQKGLSITTKKSKNDFYEKLVLE